MLLLAPLLSGAEKLQITELIETCPVKENRKYCQVMLLRYIVEDSQRCLRILRRCFIPSFKSLDTCRTVRCRAFISIFTSGRYFAENTVNLNMTLMFVFSLFLSHCQLRTSSSQYEKALGPLWVGGLNISTIENILDSYQVCNFHHHFVLHRRKS